MGQKVHPYGFRLGVTKTWRSRWFAKQDYAKLLKEDLELKELLRERLKAAGVKCGIKPSGDLDLGLLVSMPPATTSAARFTASGTQSAPVLLCRERCTLGGIRGVVVNVARGSVVDEPALIAAEGSFEVEQPVTRTAPVGPARSRASVFLLLSWSFHSWLHIRIGTARKQIPAAA